MLCFMCMSSSCMCACVHVYYTHVIQPRRSKEGFGSPGARVTNGYEPPLHAGNQTLIRCKSSPGLCFKKKKKLELREQITFLVHVGALGLIPNHTLHTHTHIPTCTHTYTHTLSCPMWIPSCIYYNSKGDAVLLTLTNILPVLELCLKWHMVSDIPE